MFFSTLDLPSEVLYLLFFGYLSMTVKNKKRNATRRRVAGDGIAYLEMMQKIDVGKQRMLTLYSYWIYLALKSVKFAQLRRGTVTYLYNLTFVRIRITHCLNFYFIFNFIF